MIDISRVHINHHRNYCNCKCIYCVWWRNPIRPLPIRPLLDELLDSGIVNKNAIFVWGGGESTLLPEFADTVSWLLKNKFRQEVLTNGLQYSPAIGNMLREGMGQVFISLDSGTEKTYRAIKGVNGFKPVIETIKKYATSARNIQDIVLKYIIFDKNNAKKEIDSFFDICSIIGKITVALSFDIRQVGNLSISNKSKDAFLYFKQKAAENGHPYFDWMDFVYPGMSNALISCGTRVYYWGCGEYYQIHKNNFSHCAPQYILLDKNPDNLLEKDGIPVCHPSEMLPHGERLPIVIFALNPAPILRTIAEKYPWYTAVTPRTLVL